MKLHKHWIIIGAVFVMIAGMQSSSLALYCTCWYSGCGSGDWGGGGGGGCGSGDGFDGALGINNASGTATVNFNLPGMPSFGSSSEPLSAAPGGSAAMSTSGGQSSATIIDWTGRYLYCYYWDGTSWTSTWGTGPQFSTTDGVNGGAATFTKSDGSAFVYDNITTDGVTARLSSRTDSLGRRTVFNYDPTSGQHTSTTMPDGAIFAYGYPDSTATKPTSVTWPSESMPRMQIEYNDRYNGTSPSQVTVTGPENPGEQFITEYTYDSLSRIETITNVQTHIVTRITYDGVGRVEYVRVMEDPRIYGSSAKIYTQTGYTYDTVDPAQPEFQWLSDGSFTGQYSRTTIREYTHTGSVECIWEPINEIWFWVDTFGGKCDPTLAPGDPSRDPACDSNGPTDRKIERYYYRCDGRPMFLRAVKDVWYENDQERYTATKRKVCVNPTDTLLGKLFGRPLTVTVGITASVPGGTSTTTYDYYNPNTEYAAALASQYDVSSPDYPVAYSPGSGVMGNGNVRSMTVTPAGGLDYVTTYRYLLKDTPTGPIMTSFVTLTKDSRGYLTKNVLNDNGSTNETYLDDGNHNFTKVKSYTYYPTSQDSYESRKQGLVHTVTVHGISTNQTNVDSVSTYSYTFAGDPSGDADNADGGSSISVSDANGKDRKFHFNAMKQMIWERDECGKKTDYAFDYRGRPTTTTYPGGATTGKNYNCCNISYEQDENGDRVYHEYDSKGRLTKSWTGIQDSSGSYPLPAQNDPLAEYTYDETHFGLLKYAVTYSAQGVARTTTYTYDGKGRLARVQNPVADPVAGPVYDEYYQYDDLCRLVATLVGTVVNGQVQDGKVTVYNYDNLDRVTAVKRDFYSGGTGTWPVTDITIAIPDVSYSYVADTQNLSDVTESLGTSTYTYDPVGRIGSYTPAVPAGYGTIRYEWDNLSHKKSMTIPLGVGNLGRRLEYKYDDTGKPVGLAVIPVSTPSATTLETTSPDPDSKTRFFYDDRQNRVKHINKAGHVYYFVHDPTAPIPAVVYEQGPAKRYLNVREPDGELIARETYNTGGSKIMNRTYHFDGLGNTLALSDENGVVTDTYSYDEWGNVKSHTGPGTLIDDNPYQYVGKFGYYTHYQEPTFNLVQLGVRYYDPVAGRFTQKDPLKEGYDFYAYGLDNPLKNMDPRGLFCVHIGGKCFGTTCSGDPTCPPSKPKPPKPPKPPTPPPACTTPPSNPIPPEIWVALPYIIPDPASTGVSLCDPDATCGAIGMYAQKKLADLEVAYGEGKISEEEYNRRKAVIEDAIKGCSKYQKDVGLRN